MSWPFAIVGADYRAASTAWRARLVLSAPERQALFHELEAQGARGFVQLSTCNRTEWLVAGERPDWLAQLLVAEIGDRWSGGPRPQTYVDEAAARHWLRVAVGLESFAVGERQIAGQLHKAFEQGRDEATICTSINLLATSVGRTVARASAIRGLSTAKAGVHVLVSDAVKAIDGPVLVVGAGVIGRSIAEKLRRDGRSVVVANRTARAGAISLDEARSRHDWGAVVLATGASSAVWHPGDPVGERLVDVGSPRQAHPELDAVDLDALLTGRSTRRPKGGAEVVRQGLDELERALNTRQHRTVVHAAHQLYDQHANEALPALLDQHGVLTDSPQRRALEADLRALLRAHLRAVIDTVGQEAP